MNFTSDIIQCCTYFVSVDFRSCLWYYRHGLLYSSGSPLLQEGCCWAVYFPSCASTCIGPSSPRLGGRRSARWEAGGPIQTSVQAARSSNTANIQPAQPHPLQQNNFAKKEYAKDERGAVGKKQNKQIYDFVCTFLHHSCMKWISHLVHPKMSWINFSWLAQIGLQPTADFNKSHIYPIHCQLFYDWTFNNIGSA